MIVGVDSSYCLPLLFFALANGLFLCQKFSITGDVWFILGVEPSHDYAVVLRQAGNAQTKRGTMGFRGEDESGRILEEETNRFGIDRAISELRVWICVVQRGRVSWPHNSLMRQRVFEA